MINLADYEKANREFRDRITKWETENNGKIDTATPLDWQSKVFAETGKWPEGFVWGYKEHSVWGEPVAITDSARIEYDLLPPFLR